MKLTEQHVISTLADVGTALLSPKYRDQWETSSPTNGYCYIVAEVLFHYVLEGVTPVVINLGDGTTHWYVKNKATGEITDYTRQQFGKERIPYERGVYKGFMKGGIQTPKGYISKRGHELALRLGVVRNEMLLEAS